MRMLFKSLTVIIHRCPEICVFACGCAQRDVCIVFKYACNEHDLI